MVTKKPLQDKKVKHHSRDYGKIDRSAGLDSLVLEAAVELPLL